MYLINIYKELRVWRKVKKIALQKKGKLDENNFRVDWVGRIYTVINLPDEVLSHQPQVQEGYVLGKLRDYDELFLSLGISDVLVPEMVRLENMGAFLLILTPPKNYLNLLAFVLFISKTIGLLFLLRILYLLFVDHSETAMSWWTSLTNWIF